MMIDDDKGPSLQEVQEVNEMFDKLLPWMVDFCAANDFYKRDGSENVSRAFSLCTGLEPRTRKERDFATKALAEVSRRWPGASYPAKCILPASNTAHLNRMQ